MSEGIRLALIVACDRYSDPELKQLEAPSQDAEAFARILENPKIGGFKVTSLINQPHWIATEKINGFLQNCNREDTVLLYFSCHGIKDKDGRLYFATVTTNRTLLFSTGIQSNFVNDLLDQCRARQKVVLLDCCYSGAFEKGRIVRADKQVNATESFGKGTVIITASDSMQYAFEGDKIESLGKGSYFTDALVKGLESEEADHDGDGKITYSELYDYVYEYVRRITPDQTPTLNTHNVEGDFVIFENLKDIPSSFTSAVAQRGSNDESHEAHDPLFQLIGKARLFLKEQQYDKAINLFDSALLLNQRHIQALNGKGVALCKKKRYEEALECFNEVLKMEPGHSDASNYVEMITDRINRERNPEVKSSDKDIRKNASLEERSEKKVIKALDKSTEIPMELIKKGDMFMEKRMYQEALLCYDQALKIEPRSELAWKRKGNALQQKGDFDEAFSCYNEAWKINPPFQTDRNKMTSDEPIPGADPRNRYNDPTLPYYNPHLDKRNDSMQSIQKPLQPYPNDAAAWHNKGTDLFNSSKYEEAIACYDKAIEIDPKDAYAWCYKGLALVRLDRDEEAIAYFDQATVLKPDYAFAWWGKGVALGGSGKYEEAIASFDQAIVLKPDYADAWYCKGLVLNSGLRKNKDADKCFKIAKELGHE